MSCFNKSSRPFPYKNGIAALYTFITFHSLLDQYGVHILHYAAERSKGTFSMIRYVCIQKHIMLPRLLLRVRPRFFDQVGHETMYAFSENKLFSTNSCHEQKYFEY